MMVSWLSSFLTLGSSLPLVETPPHVLGKAQPCPILSVSGTNTNYCHCVTFSPRDFASLRAVVTGQCYTERLNGNLWVTVRGKTVASGSGELAACIQGQVALKYLACIYFKQKLESCPFLPGFLPQCSLLGSGPKAGQTSWLPQPRPLVATPLGVPQA